VSSDCWRQNQATPICNSGICRNCQNDQDCGQEFLTYQSCNLKTGSCVADTYSKGFYVAAVVLGSIAVFLVVVVLILLAMGVGKK